ncbi:hypothetical protein VCRA2112O349_50077 [Vibrio crassostreae]|nr:hypothetical protein VCRA2113O197_100171 [Vibrio crassostreae]CAK1728785.1 hypothetical protein VCRA2113O221_110170 [Vibrio crassostreae]CAK1729009.1 hypothetical protein VCRA2113O196_110173 [Vibrio crassostreae]CAK1744639.1 hypothetical protein VCRA2119O382_120105 [Vibrio crassostreae]CAK2192251.1 hypothetical protein VCRA2110O172_50220 [Vibrio crassostreae]
MSDLVILFLSNWISSLDLKYILAFESKQNLPFDDTTTIPFEIISFYRFIISHTNNSLPSIKQFSKI